MIEVCLNCGHEARLDELENTDACPGCGEDGEFVIMEAEPPGHAEEYVMAFQTRGAWYPVQATYSDLSLAVKVAQAMNHNLRFPVRFMEFHTGRQIGSWK